MQLQIKFNLKIHQGNAERLKLFYALPPRLIDGKKWKKGKELAKHKSG